ncbi:MAG TPA: HlyD family secretion protein [Rhodopila sp.]|uniref:HlyD family secretion protein n=1 Tax=Rhodopila sp. TaxID=2480087 RepID=UPI002B5FB7E4|nr:HlyD family secretion protein [Rhodopila sp.]HVY18362.1 HlyD family secretion protein [Rhodopila sp.]
MSHIEASPAALPPASVSTPNIAVPATQGRTKLNPKKALLAGAGILALAAGAYFGTEYWTVGRFQVSTDDAYVQADNTTIAPKVSGYLSAVLVGDNQPVKAGQVLARIDPRDFAVALEQARADVAAARATVANKQAALAAQQSVIEGAKATIAVDAANETFAKQDSRRYATLAADGWGTVQKAQETASRIAAAQAAVDRDTAALANATRQVDVLTAEVAQAEAALSHARAVEDQAELSLSYTTIVAPDDGVVGNRTLRVGQYVQAGTQLMSVVPAASAYIVANYKETQLTDVRTGQPVSISVDMFPGEVFHGHVDSLAPASGQEFALLPPDNATGNFTKVVQRIPVKILLDDDNSLGVVLRPGMSVYPSIDTKPVRND